MSRIERRYCSRRGFLDYALLYTKPLLSNKNQPAYCPRVISSRQISKLWNPVDSLKFWPSYKFVKANRWYSQKVTLSWRSRRVQKPRLPLTPSMWRASQKLALIRVPHGVLDALQERPVWRPPVVPHGGMYHAVRLVRAHPERTLLLDWPATALTRHSRTRKEKVVLPNSYDQLCIGIQIVLYS